MTTYAEIYYHGKQRNWNIVEQQTTLLTKNGLRRWITILNRQTKGEPLHKVSNLAMIEEHAWREWGKRYHTHPENYTIQ